MSFSRDPNADAAGSVQLPPASMTASGTVAGLFAERSAAEQAIAALERAGFAQEQIGVVLRDGTEVDPSLPGETLPTVGAATGAVGGGVLGGVAGLLAGLGALAIPGVGPVIAGGILASTFAGFGLGAAGGSLIGALAGTGLSEEAAGHFESGIQSGAVLVTVQSSGRVLEALNILNEYGADTGPASVEPSVADGSTSVPFEDTAAVNRTPVLSPEVPVDGVQRLELRAEELVVHKERVPTGEVTVHKEVITEMQTIQVPVQREELVIERNSTEDGTEQTIRVPLSEERVTVEKQSVVLEEVTVRKQEIQETERVSAELRREELRIEGEGQIENPPTIQ